MNFKIKFDDKQVRRALRNVKKQTTNVKPVLERIGKLEEKKAKHRIRSSKTDPDGRRWAPWAYATLVQRLRAGDAARGILYKTGQLLRGFKSSVSRNILKITNSARYAEYLQVGTRDIPARPFLGWDKRSTKDMTNRFRLWISRGWK